MRQNLLSLVSALLLTSGHSKIFGGSATWTTGSGDWDISGNWTAGGPPNGIGETATFGDTGTTFPTETVTIDTGYATVGAFVFNITTGAPFSFVQKNAGGLTLDNGGGGATINVTGQQGVDFGLPITLSDDLTINVSESVSGSVKLSALAGAQNVTVDNLGINSVSFYSASYTGTTSLLSGIVNLSGAASLDSSSGVSISSGAYLVVNAGFPFPNYTFNNLTGDGVLAFLVNTNAIIPSGTFSGHIIESPGYVVSVEKTTGGVLMLTGTSSYSGGTTVSGGTLQGTTNSLKGAITSAAGTTVIFDQDFNGSYAGAMSGDGALTKQGTGTVTLSGKNTYSGGTTVFAGILQIDIQSLVGNITNNGTVIFDTGANGTFGGDISGTGKLIKQGNGSVALSGTNTYSGETIVANGVLRGPASSLQGNIINLSAVIFDQALDGVYGGIMSGSGSLTKNGPGKLTLSGTTIHSGATTINEGTLAFSGLGRLAASGTVELFGASTLDLSTGLSTQTIGNLKGSSGSTIDFGGATTQLIFGIDNILPHTFAGSIIGSGSIQKNGSGMAIFSGNNSYTGGTTIANGTLKGTTASLQGDIENNATMVFDQDVDGTYMGVLSGTGVLEKNGAGTVSLSGVNTYTGITLINQGTLALIGSGTLSSGGTVRIFYGIFDISNGPLTQTIGSLKGTSASQVYLGNNDLIFGVNDASSTGFNGVISGSGKIIKQLTNTVVLGGAPNTYTGGTEVLGGTLQGTVLTLKGDILNDATVIFDQEIDGTYPDVMSGGGALIKEGPAVLTLSQTNTYTGTTTIKEGTLLVSGSIAGGITTVESGATLQVSGAVNSTLTSIGSGALLRGTGSTKTVSSSGTVSPGSSIGTLTILGNYTQSTTADLLIEIDAAGNSDLLDISGSATLDGTLTLSPEVGVYQTGTHYVFMNYASRTGTLSLIEDSSLDFVINYEATFAELINSSGGAILPVLKRDLRGNPRAVADYLFCQGYLPPHPDLLNVMEALVNVPASEFPKDLVKLSPVQFGALPLITLQGHRLVADAIQEINPCQRSQKEWRMWLAPIGSYYDQRKIDGQTPFDAYTVGGSSGIAYFFSDHLFWGGNLGYTYSNLDWDDNRGQGHWHSVYLGPSLGWTQENFYVNGLVLGCFNTYQIDRIIHFPGIRRTARNHHHSYDAFGRIAGGYRFLVCKNRDKTTLFIQPEGRLSYFNHFQKQYTEVGANSINLSVDSKYSAFLQPEVLVKCIRDFYASNYCLTQTVHVGWSSTIPLSSANYTSRFYKQQTCQSHFSVRSFNTATNHLNLGGELTLKTNSHWIFELSYKADLLDKSSIQSWKCKVEKVF